MKNLIFIILLLFITTFGYSQSIKGYLIDYGKSDKLVVNKCGKDISIKSRIVLKTDSGEVINLYLGKSFNLKSFDDSIYPLIREDKNPYVKLCLLDCDNNDKNSDTILIATKIYLLKNN